MFSRCFIHHSYRIDMTSLVKDMHKMKKTFDADVVKIIDKHNISINNKNDTNNNNNNINLNNNIFNKNLNIDRILAVKKVNRFF